MACLMLGARSRRCWMHSIRFPTCLSLRSVRFLSARAVDHLLTALFAEDTQQQVARSTRELMERTVRTEKAIAELQNHIVYLESNQNKQQESIERRFATAQDTFSKLALGLYDSQSDVCSLRSTLDQLQMRECEATRLQQNLQSSQDQAMEWLQKLKADTGLLQSELYAAKQESSTATVAVASDVQVLAKDCAAMRNTIVQQNAKWMSKLANLTEAMDRQDKMSKDQFTQRLDALSDNVNMYELRSREAMNSLLKNHSRIRNALDEGMALCTSEIKAVSNECKSQHMERQAQLDQVLHQFATQSVEWTHTHQDLRISVETIAHQLKLSL